MWLRRFALIDMLAFKQIKVLHLIAESLKLNCLKLNISDSGLLNCLTFISDSVR